jgi:nucleoside-diphosphate-sugar epimerase
MNYLVTGAAGFVGSEICRQLLDAGHTVTGLDRAEIPPMTGLSTCYRMNLSEPVEMLERLCRGAIVIHAAARVGLTGSLDEYLRDNLTASERFLRAARHAAGFIYVSTSSVYGEYATGDESCNCNPVSFYGVSKLAAEHMIRSECRQRGQPFAIVRLFSVYGPGQRSDMGIRRFMAAALKNEPIVINGDGSHVRCYTYISDAARALTLVSCDRDTYNIAGEEPFTTNQVVHLISGMVGRSLAIQYGPSRPGDQIHCKPLCDRLRWRSGWRPRVKFVDGLQEELAWLRELSC